MKKPTGKSALDLLEEALHLLRRTPPAAFASYYLGTLPFVLGLLYFWADMSRGAFAHEHVVGASLSIAFLFVWMKCGQSIFCADLRARAAFGSPPPWTWKYGARLVLLQAAWQPLALFARPLALLITLPYAWVFAFFQNLLVFGASPTADFHQITRKAAAQAGLWTGQNFAAQGILTLFGLFVWINVATAMLAVPSLLKTFFGFETMFTRNSWGLLNSTFFAASCAGAYLCVNPLTQAFYVLRCFYGESLQTGEDLRVTLSSFAKNARVALIAWLVFGSVLPLHAATETRPATVDSRQLDQSIEQVLSQREFAWRMPREPLPKSSPSWARSFFDGLGQMIKGWIKPLKAWAKKIADWFADYARRHQPSEKDSRGKSTWQKSLRWLFVALIGAALAVLVFLLWKRWKSGRRTPVVIAQALPATPDLHAENISADQLPEDGWLRLAREMSERGELRLALRAAYLASLAHLGARELIVLARHKSNREYERDLHRRARARSELLHVFGENLQAFERTWYGRHDVTHDTLTHFQANLEKIRAC